MRFIRTRTRTSCTILEATMQNHFLPQKCTSPLPPRTSLFPSLGTFLLLHVSSALLPFPSLTFFFFSAMARRNRRSTTTLPPPLLLLDAPLPPPPMPYPRDLLPSSSSSALSLSCGEEPFNPDSSSLLLPPSQDDNLNFFMFDPTSPLASLLPVPTPYATPNKVENSNSRDSRQNKRTPGRPQSRTLDTEVSSAKQEPDGGLRRSKRIKNMNFQ